MSGGINAWKGLTAEGAPEAGMAYFRGTEEPGELISLSWLLEDGTKRFYAGISALLSDAEAVALFKDLVIDEEHHKAMLADLYRDLANAETVPDNLGTLESFETSDDIMEGGTKVSEALEWAKGKDPEAVLEFAISLEANSYDLYTRMGRKMEDDKSRKIFVLLSQEEKKHLERMTLMFEKRI